MSRISLVALVGVMLAQPAEAFLTEDDLMAPKYAQYAVGKCEYKGYVLEFECDRERKSVDKCVLKNTYLHGNKVPNPNSFPMPNVVVRYPEILYCIDPPEKKKEEKKPFLCC